MSAREDIDDLQRGLLVVRQRVRDLAINKDESERLAPALSAIQRVWATSNRALMNLSEEQVAVTVHRCDAPQSSVEIETMAKGGPKVTVKVYCEGAEDARDLAVHLYEETLAHFAEAAKVTPAEAAA